VHHHDGFIEVDGIFHGRFDVVLTNPPFGAKVEPTDVITASDVEVPPDIEALYERLFKRPYKQARERMKASVGSPIASLYELPKDPDMNVKTELLFLERCVKLLKPGGRLAIVLPDGVLNNPSLTYVRDFCEVRVVIQAVVSLPAETFKSSKTNVKTSVVFLRALTADETKGLLRCGSRRPPSQPRQLRWSPRPRGRD
jgi:type I restriction enzyme M protein